MLEPLVGDSELFWMFFYEYLPEEHKALLAKILKITDFTITAIIASLCVFFALKAYVVHKNVKPKVKFRITRSSLGLFIFLFFMWRCSPAPVWDYLKEYGFDAGDGFARFAFIVADAVVSPLSMIFCGGILTLIGLDRLKEASKYAYLPKGLAFAYLFTPLVFGYTFVPVLIVTDFYNVSLVSVARTDLPGLLELLLPRVLLTISSISFGVLFGIPIKVPEPYYSAVENKPKKKSFLQTELGTELFLTAMGILFALPASAAMYVMMGRWSQLSFLFYKVFIIFMMGCVLLWDVAVVLHIFKIFKLLITRSK